MRQGWHSSGRRLNISYGDGEDNHYLETVRVRVRSVLFSVNVTCTWRAKSYKLRNDSKLWYNYLTSLAYCWFKHTLLVHFTLSYTFSIAVIKFNFILIPTRNLQVENFIFVSVDVETYLRCTGAYVDTSFKI